MSSDKKARRPGEISADTLYTGARLQELGIGCEELREARQSGIVVPREMSRSFWYSGKELIEWSLTKQVLPARKRSEQLNGRDAGWSVRRTHG